MSSDVISISSPNHLEKIRINPNSDFVLEKDINCENKELKPIKKFSGTINGKGHVIKNLTINPHSHQKDHSNQGVSFIIDNQGLVKNICFSYLNITSCNNGAVSGCVINNLEEGVIDNVCIEKSLLTDSESIAGLVHYNDGIVKNCEFGGNIQNADYASGIVHRNFNKVISNKVNQCAVITSSKCSAGLVKNNTEGSIQLNKFNGNLECDDKKRETMVEYLLRGNFKFNYWNSDETKLDKPIISKGEDTEVINNTTNKEQSKNLKTEKTLYEL